MPRSVSRVIDSVVTNSVEIAQHDADQPRHDVQHGELLGVVARVQLELKRQVGRRATWMSGGRSRSSALVSDAERGRRVADRRRIGGIGIHQHRRLFAAIDRAVEIGRNVHHEQQFAIGEARFGLAPRTRAA